MSLFKWPVFDTGIFGDAKDSLKKGVTPLLIGGCITSQKAHLLSELGKDFSRLLVVAKDDLAAKELYDDLSSLMDDVSFYPAKDLIFYQADLTGGYQAGQRIMVMKKLCEGGGKVIVTAINGLMNVLPDFEEWKNAAFELSIGATVMEKAISKKLVEMGYTKRAAASSPGEFAVRGDIMDIYPYTDDNPVRIEFFGDEIDNLREFDAESQRTIRQLDSAKIYPACEFLLSDERKRAGLKAMEKEYLDRYESFKSAGNYDAALNLKASAGLVIEQLKSDIVPGNLYSYLPYFDSRSGSLLDAFKGEGTLIVLDDHAECSEKGRAVYEEWEESCTNRLEKGYMLSKQKKALISDSKIWTAIKKQQILMLSGAFSKTEGIKPAKSFNLSVTGVASYKNDLGLLTSDLKKWKKSKRSVVLLYQSRSRAQRMADILYDEEVGAVYAEKGEGTALPGQTLITCGRLKSGFNYGLYGLIVLTETDVSGAQAKKRKKHGIKGNAISSLADLKFGDYVVHETYGLGIYRGIEKKIEGRIARDYIRVEYGDNSSLYVPAMQFEYIQKYASSDKENVKLSKLYGNEWKNTKNRVLKAVGEIAQELVDLYAVRSEKKGHAFAKDTLWQKEFEESFPFDETEDQLQAINEVKRDMESDRIMDRLICGDVGFGKTEIALRAAFKAVQDGKQVVFLVPTTILCQQHYNTFASRLADYPVRVDMLSRFCTPSQVNSTLKDAAAGKVDILIGTHRVLSKDVVLKNLGLLIIDEEQRFGVTHKERIKQLKKDVDVLTLTATPIPRTLHMSLIGVRDLSTLTQPPQERVPIQTYVSEYTDELVREAIKRETSRGGQVYYVYNRVINIAAETEALRELLPGINIEFAHGQMSERQLEKIMMSFIAGEIDVLVSTTIIETGLDIPNVNTIIIRNAERFGLSQLYQLRGRVGRSSRTAYAFILYNRQASLSDIAKQRLEAIRQFTELGSGIKIAKEDLEIRGAGNLLGTKQHGHLEAVGYDLYCKMLNEAVLRLKGEIEETEERPVKINIALDAFLPKEYIAGEGLMLDCYKRIMAISGEDDYRDMQDELTDRFGDMPPEAENLLFVAWMKAWARDCGIEEVTVKDNEIRLTFSERAPIDPSGIQTLLDRHKGCLSIVTKPAVTFVYTARRSTPGKRADMNEMLKTLLGEIKMLLVKEKSGIVS